MSQVTFDTVVSHGARQVSEVAVTCRYGAFSATARYVVCSLAGDDRYWLYAPVTQVEREGATLAVDQVVGARDTALGYAERAARADAEEAVAFDADPVINDCPAPEVERKRRALAHEGVHAALRCKAV